MECERNIQKQTIEIDNQNVQEYGIHIPDHAILRLAGFFFGKIQEEAENKKE